MEVYNSSGTGEDKANYWVDVNAASDWTTYWYKVQAVDNSSQKSIFSNIARCGDWAVPDIQAYDNFTVQLNGSLIILPTGNLTFKHVDLILNCSYKAEFGIDVRPGGQLFILDIDDDPETTYDRTNISALKTDNTFYFVVNGAKFEMKNSHLSYCGSNKQLTYMWWNIYDYAPKVMQQDDPWTRGLYVIGNDALITNNVFSNNFVSILIDGGNNCKVLNNTFSDNVFGLYLNNAQDNTLNNNTFEINQAYPIYLFNSEDNTINSNNFSSYNNVQIVLYDNGCNLNAIRYNNISDGMYGICLYEAGVNNNVSNNDFKDIGTAIQVFNSPQSYFFDNNFTNTGGIYVESSDFITINGGYSNGDTTSFYLEHSNNSVISNIIVENSLSFAVVLVFSRDFQATNLSINNSYMGGMGFMSVSNVILKDINIENCPMGIAVLSYPDIEISQDIECYNITVCEGIQQSIILDRCENFVLYNCSLNASGYIFNLTSSSAILYNISFNQKRVKINDSSISFNWLVDVMVKDWLDNPVANAHVQIRKALGTLVFDGYTDIDGYIRWIWIFERTQFSHSNDTANPHFFIADLGNHSGSLTTVVNRSEEKTVHLENEPPTASNVIISPSYPTTVNDLTLSYQYTDPENDLQGQTMILWYIDGLHNSTFNNLTTIDSQYTKKDQTWFCEVIPHDGSVYGVPMTSIPVSIQNTPPEVTGVYIEETNPRSSDSLHVNYTFSDIDGDLETWSLYRWYVDNGTGWVYSGVDSLELSPIYTKKGDRWKCNVTPGDGDDYGTPMESAPVTINNSAPEAYDLSFTPGSPNSNETFYASYEYDDLDGDSQSGSIIGWYRNTFEVTDLNGSFSVDPSRTQQGDVWYYILIPSDGEDYGTLVQSESIVIGNTPPSVSNVLISPLNPDTADDLTVGYSFNDEDDDLESDDTIIKWYRKREGDIEFTYTGYQGKTLSSAFTTKNEVWKCEVIPHDGLSYGTSVFSTQEIAIENSPPTASDVYISPTSPTTETDLVAHYDYSDLDFDSEAGTEIIWYRDGVAVPELNNQLTVSRNHTEKGQVWNFTVRLRDGFDFGEVMVSSDITIQNSPPMASDLIITPRFPLGDENLVASYTYFDDDGDTEASFEIRWYKNGLLQTFYNDKLEVENAATEKGDLWYYTLRVSDGVEFSEGNSSHYIIIENSKPVINSITPQPAQLVINETESLEFFVDAHDPDGDILLFKWRLDKSSVGDDEFYQFTTDYESDGTYTLNLTVQDVGEKSYTLSYEWDITVNNVNLLPQIEVLEPITKNVKMKEDTSLKFMIDESDPDPDDTLQITWYFDDVVVQTSGTSYTYFADYAAAGDHVVTAVVSDGTDDVEHSWNLTVADVAAEEFLGLNYDLWGILLEVLVIAATGFLAFIGYRKIRKKKGALKTYMAEIDEISAGLYEDPEEYERKLNELEEKINSEFKEGNIEDLHYLMLQEIIASKRGEVRKAEVSRKFEKLPEGVVKDLNDMLKDGKISREEYESFVATISMTKALTPYQKKELSKMIEKWEVKDKGSVEEEAAAEKVEPKKDETDKEIDEIINSLNNK
ncbi:MAG: right-handed parallel beta-helix repeat-containing protein [Methanomassiliicoccales archaeon]|nr:MAG: right-handed parallel beta-helix repeat-containing protein [Methanomassiliicoccales archaeon]